MNLNLILLNDKIKNLTYDTVFTEKPMSNLIDFDYKTILSPPPENTSSKTQKELAIVSKFTLNRTQEDLKLIYNMDVDMDSYYINFLKKNNLKYPERYINLFYDVVEPVLMNAKSFWNRPRPSQLAKLYDIPIRVIVTDTIHTASYPSGHTVYSKLVSNILSDIYPQYSKSFDKIAQKTAEARVKQGVHYPSDNAASIKFINYIYNKLQTKLRKYYDNS